MVALPLVNNHKSRKRQFRPVEQRLIEALSTLSDPPARSSLRPTISTLCRLAGVSRNTLYRYYPDLAARARRLRRRRGSGPVAHQSMVKALRAEIAALRGQLAQLATLADHYFAAAEEQRALVARGDRELAALKVGSRPARIPR